MATNSKVTLARSGVTLNAGHSFKAYGNPVPYLAPWVVAVTFAVLGVASRGLRVDTYAWYWSPLVIASVGALAYVTWRASRARGALTCALATAGVGAAGVWVWTVAGMPEISWRPFVLYLLAAIPVCGGANALTAFKEGSTPNNTMHDKLANTLAKVRNLNEVTVIDGQVRGRIEVEPGESVDEVRRELAPALASMYDLPANGVSITPRRGESVRVGDFRLSPDDRLAKPPTWPGPSIRPGEGTLLDPIRIGLRRSAPLEFWLTGDPRAMRNAPLITFTGMSGAGKTIAIRETLIEAMCRGEFEYWYLNSRKADQEPEWVRRGAARIETTKEGVVKAWREMRDELPERGKFLGSRGYEQWAPGCGVKLRLIVGDEAAAWAKDIERILTDTAETVRSLGVVPLLGFQRATGDRFPTSARSNFNAQLCLGVKDEVDAGMGLPDDVIDAGASPWVWQAREPGRCYLVAPGVGESEWAEDARTFNADPAELNRWGERLVESRESGGRIILPSAAAQPSGAVVPAGEGELVDDDEVPDFDDSLDLDEFADDEALAEAGEMIRDVLEGDADEGDGSLEDDEMYDDDGERIERPRVPLEVHEVDNTQPIDTRGVGMVLRSGPKMSPGDAQAHLRRTVAGLAREGVAEFKVEDVGADVLQATGMRESWLSKWLGELCREGVLRKKSDRGWYEIVAPRAIGKG